jgi:hypothetical protein
MDIDTSLGLLGVEGEVHKRQVSVDRARDLPVLMKVRQRRIMVTNGIYCLGQCLKHSLGRIQPSARRKSGV